MATGTKTIYGIKQIRTGRSKSSHFSAVVYKDFYPSRAMAIEHVTRIMDRSVGEGNWRLTENQTFTVANSIRTGKPFKWILIVSEYQLNTSVQI